MDLRHCAKNWHGTEYLHLQYTVSTEMSSRSLDVQISNVGEKIIHNSTNRINYTHNYLTKPPKA